jgi:transposase-like protein
MPRIVPAILSLAQHLDTLRLTPEVYRPSACPHCGLGCLWCHGHYPRKPDRGLGSSGNWNPVPIPRYLCPGCERTCSRLPECVAPRRWYGWAVQQLALLLLLAGSSLHRCAAWLGIDRRTARRWWQWLAGRGDEFAFRLRARFPELGRMADFRSFWAACLGRLSLAGAMAWLDRDGVVVP